MQELMQVAYAATICKVMSLAEARSSTCMQGPSSTHLSKRVQNIRSPTPAVVPVLFTCCQLADKQRCLLPLPLPQPLQLLLLQTP